MRSEPYTRPTLVAAVELLERHTQASFDQIVLRLGLEDEITDGTGVSVAKKCGQLGRLGVQRRSVVIDTVDGRVTLGGAIVREALQMLNMRFRTPPQTAFLRGLTRDGFIVEEGDRGEKPRLRAGCVAGPGGPAGKRQRAA